MELQQLKYFKAVAEVGKISDAAESLFISAPALSTSISRMEKELGVQLFDRTNNKISLNIQGQIFLKYVNQVFGCLESAKQELHHSLLQGPHISIVSVNSTMWVNLIAAFTSEFPECTLSCSSITLDGLAADGISNQHSFLLAYECDIPPAYVDKLDSVFLFETYPTVSLHKDHPLAQKAEIDIRMLAEEKIFMPVPSGPVYERIRQLCLLYDMPFPDDNSYSYLARQKMVSENMGVSFVTKDADYLHDPNICYVRLVDPLGPWKARLYWRKDRVFTEYENAFRQFTDRYFGGLH